MCEYDDWEVATDPETGIKPLLGHTPTYAIKVLPDTYVKIDFPLTRNQPIETFILLPFVLPVSGPVSGRSKTRNPGRSGKVPGRETGR